MNMTQWRKKQCPVRDKILVEKDIPDKPKSRRDDILFHGKYHTLEKSCVPTERCFCFGISIFHQYLIHSGIVIKTLKFNYYLNNIQMKKTLLFLLLALLVSTFCFGQKLVEGNLNFFKGESKINFVFDYSNVIFKFNGDDGISEKNWVERKVIEKGVEWKENWELFKYYIVRGDLQPYFIKDFNLVFFDKNCDFRGVIDENSNYTAIVKIKVMCTAKIGFFTDDPYIICDVVFIETETKRNVAQIQFKKVNGKPYVNPAN